MTSCGAARYRDDVAVGLVPRYTAKGFHGWDSGDTHTLT